VTPNYALGANCALEGVAVMMNLLYKLHKSSQPTTQATISALFQKYQEARKPRQKAAFDMSYQLTRLQTCDGWINKITMMYLLPMLGPRFVANSLADFCAGAPKLDFVPLKYSKTAKFHWKDEEVDGAERHVFDKLRVRDGVIGHFRDVRKLWQEAGIWLGAVTVVLISIILSQ